MSEINFGELNGYNVVMEYSFKMLEIIKNLKSKNINFQQMQELAVPKYEYASAKIHCIIQSLSFFQLYEKYGKNIDISSTNFKKILKFLSDINIDGIQNVDVKTKEKLFRNCLAHGRYTLSMNENGHINVFFDDPTIKIDGRLARISGYMSYIDFCKLSSIYISIFNIEKTKIVENPLFESHSMKNLSAEKIYQTFFKSILKEKIKCIQNFDIENDFDEAITEYVNNADNDEMYRNFRDKFKGFFKEHNIKTETEKNSITEEEQKFFKKYIEFIGRKKFIKFLNLQFIRSNHLKNARNIVKKNANNNTEERTNTLLKLSLMLRDSSDYYEILTAILNAKHGKLFISEEKRNDLINFISTIDHMNELGSREKASTKEFDDYMNLTLGKLSGIDVHKLPFQERDQILKEEIERSIYMSPILYSNMLICMTYYAIGYAKEVNSNYNKEIFDFRDIDLKGFQPIFDDKKRPSIETVDQHQKAINKLNRKITENRNSLLKKIRKDLTYTDKKGINVLDTIKGIIINEKISDSDESIIKIEKIKQELQIIFQEINHPNDEDKNEEYILKDDGETLKSKLQSYIDFLQDDEIIKSTVKLSKITQDIVNRLTNSVVTIDKLKKVKEDIECLKQEVVNTREEQSYQDASVFFDHIRNSITHSYFNIDYDNLFYTGDFSKIKFHLEDFDEKNHNRKTFEIELTGEDLIYLSNSIQNQLNIAISNNPKFSLENIDLNDLRDTRGIQRYDNTKYDSLNYPIEPKIVTGSRPTNQDFENEVEEDVLISGLSKDILNELQNSNDKGEKKE